MKQSKFSRTLDPSNFGKRLKEMMRALRITQFELSEFTGLTPAAISNIIHGRREPSLKTACTILNALPTTFESLCGEEPINKGEELELRN